MRASMDDVNIIKAVVMLPKFLVLSTFNSYNFLSMFMTSDSFCAIICLPRSVKCKHFTPPSPFVLVLTLYTCKILVIKILHKIDQIVRVQGIPLAARWSGCVVSWCCASRRLRCGRGAGNGFPTPTVGRTPGIGEERTNCLVSDGATRSDLTTFVARPKICFFPMNPSISMYMDSLNSNDIFLVLNNNLFSSLLILHQLAEPEPSMCTFH